KNVCTHHITIRDLWIPPNISDPKFTLLYRFQPGDGAFGLGTYQPCPVSVAVFLPIFKLIGEITLPVGRLQRGYPRYPCIDLYRSEFWLWCRFGCNDTLCIRVQSCRYDDRCIAVCLTLYIERQMINHLLQGRKSLVFEHDKALVPIGCIGLCLLDLSQWLFQIGNTRICVRKQICIFCYLTMMFSTNLTNCASPLLVPPVFNVTLVMIVFLCYKLNLLLINDTNKTWRAAKQGVKLRHFLRVFLKILSQFDPLPY